MSADRRPLRPLPEGAAATKGAAALRGASSLRDGVRDGVRDASKHSAENEEVRQRNSAAEKSLRITRRRIPELAVGVVLLGLGAIGAMLLSGDPPAKVPVLVWAEEVVRGQRVSGEDLGIVEIDTDGQVDCPQVFATVV